MPVVKTKSGFKIRNVSGVGTKEEKTEQLKAIKASQVDKFSQAEDEVSRDLVEELYPLVNSSGQFLAALPQEVTDAMGRQREIAKNIKNNIPELFNQIIKKYGDEEMASQFRTKKLQRFIVQKSLTTFITHFFDADFKNEMMGKLFIKDQFDPIIEFLYLLDNYANEDSDKTFAVQKKIKSLATEDIQREFGTKFTFAQRGGKLVKSSDSFGYTRNRNQLKAIKANMAEDSARITEALRVVEDLYESVENNTEFTRKVDEYIGGAIDLSSIADGFYEIAEEFLREQGKLKHRDPNDPDSPQEVLELYRDSMIDFIGDELEEFPGTPIQHHPDQQETKKRYVQEYGNPINDLKTFMKFIEDAAVEDSEKTFIVKRKIRETTVKDLWNAFIDEIGEARDYTPHKDLTQDWSETSKVKLKKQKFAQRGGKLVKSSDSFGYTRNRIQTKSSEFAEPRAILYDQMIQGDTKAQKVLSDLTRAGQTEVRELLDEWAELVARRNKIINKEAELSAKYMKTETLSREDSELIQELEGLNDHVRYLIEYTLNELQGLFEGEDFEFEDLGLARFRIISPSGHRFLFGGEENVKRDRGQLSKIGFKEVLPFAEDPTPQSMTPKELEAANDLFEVNSVRWMGLDWPVYGDEDNDEYELQVDLDAKEARNHAKLALDTAKDGDIKEARMHAGKADALGKKYKLDLWTPFAAMFGGNIEEFAEITGTKAFRHPTKKSLPELEKEIEVLEGEQKLENNKLLELLAQEETLRRGRRAGRIDTGAYHKVWNSLLSKQAPVRASLHYRSNRISEIKESIEILLARKGDEVAEAAQRLKAHKASRIPAMRITDKEGKRQRNPEALEWSKKHGYLSNELEAALIRSGKSEQEARKYLTLPEFFAEQEPLPLEEVNTYLDDVIDKVGYKIKVFKGKLVKVLSVEEVIDFVKRDVQRGSGITGGWLQPDYIASYVKNAVDAAKVLGFAESKEELERRVKIGDEKARRKLESTQERTGEIPKEVRGFLAATIDFFDHETAYENSTTAEKAEAYIHAHTRMKDAHTDDIRLRTGVEVSPSSVYPLFSLFGFRRRVPFHNIEEVERYVRQYVALDPNKVNFAEFRELSKELKSQVKIVHEVSGEDDEDISGYVDAFVPKEVHPEGRVGFVNYTYDKASDTIKIQAVEVIKDMQRKGIATELYKTLLSLYPGAKLPPGDYQEEEGKLFRKSFDKDYGVKFAEEMSIRDIVSQINKGNITPRLLNDLFTKDERQGDGDLKAAAKNYSLASKAYAEAMDRGVTSTGHVPTGEGKDRYNNIFVKHLKKIGIDNIEGVRKLIRYNTKEDKGWLHDDSDPAIKFAEDPSTIRKENNEKLRMGLDVPLKPELLKDFYSFIFEKLGATVKGRKLKYTRGYTDRDIHLFFQKNDEKQVVVGIYYSPNARSFTDPEIYLPLNKNAKVPLEIERWIHSMIKEFLSNRTTKFSRRNGKIVKAVK